MAPNLDRNRRILAAFEAGRSTQQLGEDYVLTEARVRAILTDERHKRSVSPQPFYRSLRAV